MNINTGLFQQQSLKLVMTKELTQAIQLLQYSSIELTKFLEEQTVENPLIELKQNEYRTRRKHKSTNQAYKNPIDYIGKSEISLSQHLLTQISYAKLSPAKRHIIEYIVQLLDENGYLYFSTEDIAKQLNVEQCMVEQSIHYVQTLDPIGVGARSLQECLLLQLLHGHNRNELAEEIIRDHFLLFAEKSWKALAKIMDVKISEIQEVFDFIQSLNPRPGALFQSMNPAYIVPDIEIQVLQGNVLISLLQDQYLPKISLNMQYFNQLKKVDDSGTKSYLQEKVDQCQWIMKSLDQRKQTLQNVMNEIVARQLDFFLVGPSELKPLTMSEVADALEIHESTVSRATKDKYVQTPYGIFEMKQFFSRNIQTTGDSDTSSTQVKNVLRQLVEKENKYKPLSDQDIVGILKKEYGILVSRRTIAKYRDLLKIPSSSKRKRYEKR